MKLQTFIVSGATFEVNLSSFMRDHVHSQYIHSLTHSRTLAQSIYGALKVRSLTLVFCCPASVCSLDQVLKGSFALDLFDEVEREIYRLMVTNNTEPLIQSQMFKLAAIALQHPSYKLKSITLANNTRGEIGGNKPSVIGAAAPTAVSGPVARLPARAAESFSLGPAASPVAAAGLNNRVQSMVSR